MRHRFAIVDVFSERPFGGNQLAVFPNADGLSDRAMQALAREFNFAETSFVFPPRNDDHTRRVRIFTPKTEVPFAGHPTVGTAAVLVALKLIPGMANGGTMTFEEGVGPVQVEVRPAPHALFARLTLRKSVVTPVVRPSNGTAAAAISLPEGAVREAWFASVGLPFCFIHVDSTQAVDTAVLERVTWFKEFAPAWSPHLFLFAGELARERRIYARMFAPALGIEEDPATGSACAALVGTLAERCADSDGIFTLQIDQGVSLGRPSAIEASAEKREGRVIHIHVGGYTVIVGQGEIDLPA